MSHQQNQTQKPRSRKRLAQHRPRLSRSTPPPRQNLQPQPLHNMQTGEYSNWQRSPPSVPKTGPHLQWITKTVQTKPGNHAVTNFCLNTGHDCHAAHLQGIKIYNHNHCTICKQENTVMEKDHLLVYPKLDHTSNELPKFHWDAKRLME
jgi:hypothetical protein